MRFVDKVGGSMTVAMPSLMTEPWNPVSGTNWVYDMMPMRGIGDNAVVPDPYTGVNQPNRLVKAEVFVQEGLPVEQNVDWAELIFTDEIVVPEDAWADWDAENQVFITAGERFTETTTTLSKVVMYYEDDLFETMKWHDGSNFTLADIVMTMIMQFDQAKEASPHYDEATVPNLQTFMGAFRGWKIVSEDPLIIEYYTDAYQLDAENNVTNLRTAYPCLGGVYTQGQGAWHNMAAALRLEANGEATFSPDKAETLEVEWMSWIAGPTLDLLTNQLAAAREETWIPFEPTLSQYITAEEADARYANLQEWFRRYGHYYVGTGPFFLQKAFPVEGTLILQRNTEYPDMADKWDRYSSAPIPEVLIDGEDRVTIGGEAVYDVYVDLNGEPYVVDEISMVRYLVFDATGELVEVGDGVAVEDGYWTVTLSSDMTGGLTEGSNQLAVIVVSDRALVPVRDTFQFVTAP